MEDRPLPAIEGDGGTMSGRNQVEKPPSRRKRWAARCKTGCLTCRARRVKCDEARPRCMRCIKAGKQCRYTQASASSDNEPPPRSSVSQIRDMVAFHKPSLQNLHSEWLGSKEVEPMDMIRLSIGTNSLDVHKEFLFELFRLYHVYEESTKQLVLKNFRLLNDISLVSHSQHGAFPKTNQLSLVAHTLGQVQHSFKELTLEEEHSIFHGLIGAIDGRVDDPFEQSDDRLVNFEKNAQNVWGTSTFKALHTPNMDIQQVTQAWEAVETWKAKRTFNNAEDSEDTEVGAEEDFESCNRAAIMEHILPGDSISLEQSTNSDDEQSESIEDTVYAEPVSEPAHNPLYRGFIAKMYYQFQIWRRPDKPPGYTRIEWTSALGAPLYVDVEGISELEAKKLQDRFGGVSVLGRPLHCPVKCDIDLEGFMSRQDLECHMRNHHLTGGTETTPSSSSIGTTTKPDRTHGSSASMSYHKRVPSELKPATGLQSSAVIASDRTQEQLCEQLRPRFLCLCISSADSVRYCPIDVTHILNDQLLFQAIRDNYNAMKQSTSWVQQFTAVAHKYMPWLAQMGFKGIELFRPRYAEFVSFGLMPWAEGDEQFLIPIDLQRSYPPEDEVWAQRWEYRPCPKSFTSFKLGEAFVKTMLSPGHSHRYDAWLHLFPKKLHSELKFQNGERNIGWGIHIAEGVDTYAAIFYIAIGSGFFGVLYSTIAKDAGAGFTVAAWIATVAALFVAPSQLRAN